MLPMKSLVGSLFPRLLRLFLVVLLNAAQRSMQVCERLCAGIDGVVVGGVGKMQKLLHEVADPRCALGQENVAGLKQRRSRMQSSRLGIFGRPRDDAADVVAQ